MIVEPSTELRKLRFAELCHLGQILNISDSWKKLMATVTKEGTDDVPKFTGEHMVMIEQAARQQRRSAAEIFLEEWGTMGKNRPTLSLLLDLLMKTQLFRAADYLAQDILKGEAPQRPSFGPAAPVDVSEAAIADLLQRQNLNDEPITNDSNFCLRTTAQIRLSQVDYPTSIFDSESQSCDCRIYENDVGIIDLQYAESKSNQILDHARFFQNPVASENCQFSKPVAENSNLIEFTASGISNELNKSENPKLYTGSDLIKFESENLHSNGRKKYENAEIYESTLLPDLNVLRCDSQATRESDEDSNVKANYEAVKKRDMFSKELPTCIENLTNANELPATVAEFPAAVNYNRELISAELPLCINDRIGFRSSDNNLNTEREFDSSERNSFNDDSFHKTLSNFSSRSTEAMVSAESNNKTKKDNTEATFPRFVTDTRKYEEPRNESEDKNEFEQKNNVLQSQELPITVLEFHKR